MQYQFDCTGRLRQIWFEDTYLTFTVVNSQAKVESARMSFGIGNEQTVGNNLALVIKEVLGEMFTESGMETVLYYLQINHKTTLRDSWENPSKFQKALMVFLGEFGGTLLMRRIVRRVLELNRSPYVDQSEAFDLESAIRRVRPIQGAGEGYAAPAPRDLSI